MLDAGVRGEAGGEQAVARGNPHRREEVFCVDKETVGVGQEDHGEGRVSEAGSHS